MTRLRQNPDPITLVAAAQRDVWTRKPHRCQYEDGRGRCRAYNARVTRVSDDGFGTSAGLEYRCPRHTP